MTSEREDMGELSDELVKKLNYFIGFSSPSMDIRHGRVGQQASRLIL